MYRRRVRLETMAHSYLLLVVMISFVSQSFRGDVGSSSLGFPQWLQPSPLLCSPPLSSPLLSSPRLCVGSEAYIAQLKIQQIYSSVIDDSFMFHFFFIIHEDLMFS